MRQYRLWLAMIKVTIVLFLLIFPTAQAGLVIGGTRFAYPENKSSISVELKNTSDRDMLVKVAVSPDDARQLTGTVESLPSFSGTVFIATPPLFVLKPDKNTKIRINRVVVVYLPTGKVYLYLMLLHYHRWKIVIQPKLIINCK